MTYHIPTARPSRPYIHPAVWLPWFGGLLSIVFGVYRFRTMVPPYSGTMYDSWLLPKFFLEWNATILCLILVVVSIVAFRTRYRRMPSLIMTGLLIGIALLFFWIAVSIPHHLPWFIQSALYAHHPEWIAAAKSSPWFMVGGVGSLLGASLLTLVMRLIGTKDAHTVAMSDEQHALNGATVIVHDGVPQSLTTSGDTEG